MGPRQSSSFQGYFDKACIGQRNLGYVGHKYYSIYNYARRQCRVRCLAVGGDERGGKDCGDCRNREGRIRLAMELGIARGRITTSAFRSVQRSVPAMLRQCQGRVTYIDAFLYVSDATSNKNF